MSERSTASVAGARLPVLYLDAEVVEFFSVDAKGATHVVSRPIEGQGALACVVAVGQVLASLPRRPRSCVLALGGTHVRHRLLHLPALTRGETRAVLQRKAAQLAECDVAHVVFAAVGFGAAPTTNADAKGAAAEERWLVAAAQRHAVRDVCVELARLGLRVRRVVSGQLSGLAHAQAMRADKNKACIVVAASRRTTTVAVVQGDNLYGENVLEGDVRTQPALAMSIVQEIKSNDAAWRKAHRGDGVEEIVLMGLPPERAPLFKTAVQSALPGANVLLVDTQAVTASLVPSILPGTSIPDAGRIQMLEACRREGALQIDLKPTLPWRPRSLAVVLSGILLLLGTAGVVGFGSLARREAAERNALREVRMRSADLDSLRESNARADRKLAALDALVDRNTRVREDGWELRGILSDVLHAFDRDAALLSVQLSPHAIDPQIQVTGTTSNDPARAMENVARIVDELESGAHFGETVASPGGGVPDGRGPVNFTLKSGTERRP